MKRVSEIFRRYWALAAVTGLLLIYGRLAWLDPLLDRDDRHILKYLRSWADVQGLLSTGRWSELVVYQPLKDLSLNLDGMLTRTFGHGTYHWTNLAIWFLCCFFGLKLLEEDPARAEYSTRKEKGPWLPARVGILLFAFHPLFVGSVAWISARKHLLSFLFILIASWELVRDEKPRKRLEIHWRSLAWYGLALLSHPIQVLWPLWVLARARWVEHSGRSRIFLRTAAVALVPLVLAGVANVAYYTGLYVRHTSAAKVVPFSQSGLAVPLLALGRYVANLLLPVRLAPVYEPSSLLGIAGLLALPLIALSARKFKSSKLIVSWLIFGLLPLLVVTVRMTQVFVSDTYALAAGFGALSAFVLAWDELSPRGWRVPAALVLVATGFIWSSAELAASWRSDAALWARASRVEPTGRSLALDARYLIDAGRLDEAASVIERLQSLSSDTSALPYLSARIVAEDSRLSREQRIRILESGARTIRVPAGAATETEAWSAYFLAHLYARGGNFEPAYLALERSLAAAQVFAQDLPAVVAELQYLCQQSRRSDCPRVAREVQGRIQASGALYWDSRPYRERLKELEGLGY